MATFNSHTILEHDVGVALDRLVRQHMREHNVRNYTKALAAVRYTHPAEYAA